MSHKPERQEKDCLNCGSMVQGRYCHVCGQENVVPKESFLSLSKHFIEDVTHYDGKFFETLKYILFRPGHIARLYALGKRAAFLNPIRMYLFTSAIFFLIFFSIVKPENIVKVTDDSQSQPLSSEERAALLEDLNQELKEDSTDSAVYKKVLLLMDSSKAVTRNELQKNEGFVFSGKRYKTVGEYDSLQKSLSPAQKDGWLSQKMKRKILQLNEQYQGNMRGLFKDFGNALLHRLPYLLFVSLPFFALLLKLIYIRRKQFYYSDHAIFTLYHYIFSFILLLLIFGADALRDWLHWNIWKYIIIALIITWPVYLVVAMKKFYAQSWRKTIVKFFLLNILAFIVTQILFIIFVLLSILQL